MSVVAVVVVVIAIIGLAAFGLNKKSSLTAKAPAVAYVNDVAITKADFDTQLNQVLATLKGQGVDTASSTILVAVKNQVLSDMINDQLVTQEIAKAKISASQQQVDAQYQALVSQAGGTDKLASQLAAANMTDAQLRANIAKQLAVQAYLTSKIDMNSATATPAEAMQFYKQGTAGQQNPPTFKSVEAQIMQQLVANKQQLLINALLQSLKAGAKISTTTTPL